MKKLLALALIASLTSVLVIKNRYHVRAQDAGPSLCCVDLNGDGFGDVSDPVFLLKYLWPLSGGVCSRGSSSGTRV